MSIDSNLGEFSRASSSFTSIMGSPNLYEVCRIGLPLIFHVLQLSAELVMVLENGTYQNLIGMDLEFVV